jgi:hypothetical protein
VSELLGITIATAVIVTCLTIYELMHKITFVCWFSARFWNIHDYLQDCGGDDCPTHFYTYRCWHCGKEFMI